MTPIPNEKKLPQINHIDGNKQNNHIKNLEWCSNSNNMKHAIKTGLVKVPGLNKENHGKAKLTDIQVEEIKFLYLFKQKTQKELSLLYKVTQQHISCIVNNKTRQ